MFRKFGCNFDIPPQFEPNIFSRKVWNGSPGNPFVHVSARLSAVGTGMIKKVPFSTFSRTK